MNVFRREMKAHRKSLIIWCVSMIFLIASGSAGKYAGFSSTGESMNDLMQAMPQSLQAITGMGSFDLSQATGFYGVLFIYMALLAAIHAVLLGSTIISKEERDKTAEFLFVKPISRRKVVRIKLLAAVVNVLVLSRCLTHQPGDCRVLQRRSFLCADVGVTIAGMLMLQLIFLMLGAWVGAGYKKSGKANAISAAILFLTFLLSRLI